MSVREAIEALNMQPSRLDGNQKYLLVSAIRRAARQGNEAARDWVMLCELNIHTSTKH